MPRAARNSSSSATCPSTAASSSVGALLLGYRADGKLAYAGRVGTGWTADQAAALYAQLDAIAAKKPALRKPLPAGAEKGVVWIEPRLVGEVEFRDWTQDELVRQASFKGLREDKTVEDIDSSIYPSPAAGGRARRGGHRRTAVRLTHPERLLWPEAGITKQGLADFYADIANWILPHITGRVLSLLRCPSGTHEKCFFAKHPWNGLERRRAARRCRREGADAGDRRSRRPARARAGRAWPRFIPGARAPTSWSSPTG